MKNFSVLFLATAFLAMFTGNAASRTDGEADSTVLVRVGDASPVLSLTTVDGQPVDFRGSVVVLSFFATWCGPCMQEMPHLQKDLWEPLKAKGLVLVAVGREHTEKEVQAFRKTKPYTFLYASDPNRAVYSRFAKQYIPRCFVIGRDGKVKYESMGFTEEEFARLVSAVKAELGNK